jgi:hypothetical protein
MTPKIKNSLATTREFFEAHDLQPGWEQQNKLLRVMEIPQFWAAGRPKGKPKSFAIKIIRTKI